MNITKSNHHATIGDNFIFLAKSISKTLNSVNREKRSQGDNTLRMGIITKKMIIWPRPCGFLEKA